MCLLTAALGFPTAHSQILHFDGEPAIVLERYDRVRTAQGWVRVHQEDVCQALGVMPARKYQNDGGRGAAEIVENSSSPVDDVVTFVDALALNWLIAGTDAHAKNFSVLIAPGNVRFAPLYDVASSILPYPDQFELKRCKLAMKVGGHYGLQDVRRRDWEKCAVQLKLAPDAALQRITNMADAIPDLAAEAGGAMKKAGLKSPLIDQLVARLTARARVCFAELTRSRSPRSIALSR